MAVSEKISEKIEKLPPSVQQKVLDFIESLSGGAINGEATEEDKQWQRFSLEQALKDLQDEDLLEYTETDLKEKWL